MMKRSALALSLVLACFGCKKQEAAPADKKEPAQEPAKPEVKAPEAPPAPPPAAEVKLADLDCSAAGDAYKGWHLMAPEGAACKENFGALEVKAGDGFQVEVHGSKLDMSGRKKEIEGNTVNKLKRYTTDTPEAIVYESDAGMGKPEFHFLAGMKVGDAEVSCEDTKGPFYTQAQAEGMLKACQSLAKK